MKNSAPVVFMVAYTNYDRDPRVRREAEALTAVGYRVVFLASRHPGQPSRENLNGVEVIRVRRFNERRTSRIAYILDYGFLFVLAMTHLTVYARRYRLIHVNNMPDFLVFSAWLPRLLGRPVIHDVHDLMPELFSEKFLGIEKRWGVKLLEMQERLAGRFATQVLTVEYGLAEILSRRGIPRGKIHVLMNLPDERIFRPRTAIPDRKDSFTVVYHGTLARRLGLDIAVRAIAELLPRIPEIRLRIIGAGEERDSLLRLRDELGIGRHIVLSEGFVPLEAIPSMIEDADIGLVPLRISAGTEIMLPTKLLEYVATGIPCVVPRTRAICQYFDSSMVRFFRAGDVGSLSDAIFSLYHSPDERRQLAIAATERFGRVYRWEEHKHVYVELVSRLTNHAITDRAVSCDDSASRVNRAGFGRRRDVVDRSDRIT
jgi:glycosyltransferase involved in cell wall biosynthesis